jgi:cytochrome oxidase Cu insertion factor (SCO1/SenC/PrrC family)
MNKTHIAFPVVLDDLAQTWPLQGIDALPVTFIIDPNGQVAKRIYGGNTEKSLLANIHELQKKFS